MRLLSAESYWMLLKRREKQRQDENEQVTGKKKSY